MPHVKVSPGQIALGIDIGGTGVKAAPVRLDDGSLVADRHRIPTPQPATPAAVAPLLLALEAAPALALSIARAVARPIAASRSDE